jgi:integrase
MLGTGIRVGELIDLQVGDVTLRDRSGFLVIREGKHGNFREIPLTNEVRTALSRYLEKHPHRDELGQPLWLSGHGPLRHRSGILRILNKYAEQAGVDQPISPHRLRHTFATRYLKSNPDDLRGLATLLGHSSLDTVMIYTQPTLEDLAGRMERFELNIDYSEEGEE